MRVSCNPRPVYAAAQRHITPRVQAELQQQQPRSDFFGAGQRVPRKEAASETNQLPCGESGSDSDSISSIAKPAKEESTVNTKRSVLVVFAVIAMLVITSCAPAPAPAAPAPVAEAPAGEAAAPAPAETEAPEAAAETVFGNLPRSETFIVASRPNLDIWDTFNPFNANEGTGFYPTVIEEPFLEWYGELYPVLAQKWEYNADGSEMTLTITENATWNDGKPVTMDDWLWSLQYFLDNLDKGTGKAVFLKDAESWEASGDNQIVFKLAKPDYRFHRNFIGYTTSAKFEPLPRHVWEGQDALEFKNPDAVASGAYKLVSCNGPTKTCIYERRDDYWNQDRLPAPKYVVWTAESSGADLVAQEWQLGNYDLGRTSNVSIDGIVRQNPAVVPLNGADPCPRRMAFNLEIKPLDDLAVRRALSLLIDRDRAYSVVEPPAYSLVVPWPYDGEPDTKFYDPSLLTKYDVGVYDPAKAAQILDEAGYALVDGKRVDKDGNPIVLSVTTSEVDVEVWYSWAKLLIEEAAKLGIEINYKALDIGGWFGVMSPGDFDIALWFGCPAVGDPIDAYVELKSEYAAPTGEKAPRNYYRYRNPELDELVAAMQASDPAKPETADLYKQAHEILIRDLPYVMLFGQWTPLAINTEHWTGMEKDDLFTFWGPHFQWMLADLAAAQ